MCSKLQKLRVLKENPPFAEWQTCHGANGIQEVSGSIPLISTKNHRFHLESMVFLYFSACFVLGVFALDNKWTTDLLNFFFLTVGRKKLWHLSKKK